MYARSRYRSSEAEGCAAYTTAAYEGLRSWVAERPGTCAYRGETKGPNLVRPTGRVRCRSPASDPREGLHLTTEIQAGRRRGRSF
jgi:hypothetical protein